MVCLTVASRTTSPIPSRSDVVLLRDVAAVAVEAAGEGCRGDPKVRVGLRVFVRTFFSCYFRYFPCGQPLTLEQEWNGHPQTGSRL
jgi:hypothetical protein